LKLCYTAEVPTLFIWMRKFAFNKSTWKNYWDNRKEIFVSSCSI